MINLRHPLIEKGFCFVDGLNIPVAASNDNDVQSSYYNGWTCSHYFSSVMAFAPDGCLIFCSLNAPGSCHDAAVARHLYDKLLYRTPNGFYAIADTAFPRNEARLRGRIKTPLKKNSVLPRRLQEGGLMSEYRRLRKFNSQLVSCRQAAEWGMRTLQGSFVRLKMPLPADNHKHRLIILMTCMRLHQVRTRLVGITQIRTVYEKFWRGDDPDSVMVYEDFANMMFRDIESNDRIARYYQLNQWTINDAADD